MVTNTIMLKGRIQTAEMSEQVKKLLYRAHVDFSTWGTGKAKTLEHLIEEVETGESQLLIDHNRKLVRRVIATGAEIFYQTPDACTIYKLVEDKQVFADGRERRRNNESSVAEKMNAYENPKDAIRRGIREELGIDDGINLWKLGVIEETKESRSYPGLLTVSIWHKFRVVLNEPEYNPEGYIEVQPDKSTYFVWVEQ